MEDKTPTTSWWQVAGRLFTEYSNNSTIHGIKYLGESKRSWLERVWWIVVFCTSSIVCGAFIFKIYDKWDTSPVIVSFSEKSTPIWKIPFPTVTICPEMQAKASIFNISEIYHSIVQGNNTFYDLTETGLSRTTAISQVCYGFFDEIDPLGVANCLQCIKDLKDIAIPEDELFLECFYFDKSHECKDLFEEIVTEEGICYTFNALQLSDIYREESIANDFTFERKNQTSAQNWSIDEGYIAGAPLKVYPRRALGSGLMSSLDITLGLYDYNLDNVCRGPIQGFRIQLHTPGEVPQVAKHFLRIPLNQIMSVAIKPQMMTTSKGLRNYPPDRRQCFFNNERRLRFFKVYTQRNCEFECLANLTLQECDCIKFHMPRFPNASICGPSKNLCMHLAEYHLMTREVEQELEERTTGSTFCNCLPACTSITYDAEISQSNVNWTGEFWTNSSYQITRLSLFFKETQFVASKRSELYGRADFVANCGGLLGLFMGVSLISFLEIFYYCTFRLASNLRKYKEWNLKPSNRLQSLPASVLEITTGKDHWN